MAPRHKASCFFTLAVVWGVALLVPFWVGQVRFALSGVMFDPDMFTLYGFARYHDASLFAHDYTADYFLSKWMPVGYAAMYRLWSLAFDPRALARLLPLVLWLSCLWPVFVSGRALGGRVNGFATLAVYACSSIFIFRMVGGMAHGFGFPLTWWAVAMLLTGSPVGLAAVTVLSALFYPIIAPVSGMMLAVYVMFPAFWKRADVMPLRFVWWKRALWLMVPGAITVALMLPMVLPQAGAYGPAINVLTQREAYPEAGNALASINPFAYTVIAYALQNSTRLGMNGGQILTLVIFGILFASILLRNARDRRPGMLRPYIYAVAFFFLLSMLVAQDHSYRFAIYNFPVLVTLFLPLALRAVSRTLLPKRVRSCGFVALVLGYVALVAQAEAQASGYLFVMEPFQQRALAFIETLPKDAMLAGWPGDRHGRIVEAVPYLAQRSVLVTWAGHPIAHRDYVLTMRDRMNALVDAYFARDVKALKALRDDFGVRYLVVNEADLRGAQPPAYIEPFTGRAKEAWQRNKGNFVALGLDKRAGVYVEDGIHILDLTKL